MRARKGMLGMLLVAAAIAACTEDGPTVAGLGGEAAGEAMPGLSLAGNGTISGRVVTTVRTFDGKELLGTVRLVDTATFEGALRRGQVHASAKSRQERFDLTVAVTGLGSEGALRGRRHEWTARSAAPEGAGYVGTRTATFVREGEAPVSEMTYRRGSEVVARVATIWVPVPGGWLLRSRTVTAFRDGRPVSSVETVAVDQRVSVERGALGARSVATADVASVWAAVRATDTDKASEEGDCQKEFDAMNDALDRFTIASVAMLGCLAGPWACFAATLTVVTAARGVDVAEARLNRCLGGEQ